MGVVEEPLLALAEQAEPAGGLKTALAERGDQVRALLEQRGERLLGQARALVSEHPREVIGGLAALAYVAGKLLRGPKS